MHAMNEKNLNPAIAGQNLKTQFKNLALCCQQLTLKGHVRRVMLNTRDAPRAGCIPF